MNRIETTIANQPRARAFSKWMILGMAIIGMVTADRASATVTLDVDSVADEADDNTLDPACHTASGACTLRAAIMTANKVLGENVDIVVPAGIYVLGIPGSGIDLDDMGDLNLLTPASGNPIMTISGAGAADTIIDAGTVGRILVVGVGRTATIAGLTLRNGQAHNDGSYGYGGGIYNYGTVTIDHCTLNNNTAPGALPGIPGQGGAIYNLGTMTVLDSSLTGNAATGDGGAARNLGFLDIRRSTLNLNIADLNGGAIANSGTLYVGNGTITTNHAYGQGGGISNTNTSNIYSSTIVFNKAETATGFFGNAGGGTVNSATFNVRNTVIAYNVNLTSYDECKGAVGLYGNNSLANVDALNCGLTQHAPGSYSTLTSSSEFGPLQDNGGSTMTHAIAPTSVMINGADATLGCVDQYANPLVTDQRGKPRVFGHACDIGAFEYTDLLFAEGFDHGLIKGLVINEVDYDQPGTDNTEFIEIYNNSAQPIDLTGVAVVLVDGQSTLEYLRVELGSAGSLPAGGYLVVHSSNLVIPSSAVSIVFPGGTDQVKNGSPGGIALMQTNPPSLLDALSYEGAITLAQIDGLPFAVSLVRGTAVITAVQDSDVIAGSFARLPNGNNTNNSYGDWAFTPTPTPGAANH